MDRISSLPNEIICHIVSFLSAKEAAFTTVLSKRWQNLFSIISLLQFDDCKEDEIEGNGIKFTDFVDRVLAMPASSRVRKFTVRFYKRVDPAQYALVNRCLCDVLKRGILDLEVRICFWEQYSLPFEVFTSETVVKLELGHNFVVDALPENAFLPAVKTLVLNSIRFKDLCGCAFEKLLSACPVLKELSIYGMHWEHWKWSGNLSSPTLERLIIFHGDFYQCDFTRISLDTPRLTYLELNDVVPDEYPVVNLDSLVEAKLELMLTVDHRFDGFVDDHDTISSNPTNLIKGLRNVEIMNLQSFTTLQAFSYFHEAIPVFKNLYHLTITNEEVGNCLRFLPFLLKKSPNLTTLVINGPLHYNEDEPKSVCECLLGYSFLFPCRLKVLMITDYNGTTGEVEQLKHFVEKLPCLELVKLRSRERDGDDINLKLPRASWKCKIEVTFH